MCARYTLDVPPADLAEIFGVDADATDVRLAPRWNIAPSQPVAAIRAPAGRRELVFLKWGLLPSWAKDAKIANQLINARSETVFEKPSFRKAILARRCLLPTSGFYEWRPEKPRSRPFHLRRRDGRPFAFAAIWETWTPPGLAPIESCSLLTTEANAVSADIHDRMPVILDATEWSVWLDPAVSSADRLRPLLDPYPADAMESFPVGYEVGSPKNDFPSLIVASGDVP